MPGNYDNGRFGAREMHDTVCNECNKACQVPFKPTEGKPVYCKDCYSAKRPKRF